MAVNWLCLFQLTTKSKNTIKTIPRENLENLDNDLRNVNIEYTKRDINKQKMVSLLTDMIKNAEQLRSNYGR